MSRQDDLIIAGRTSYVISNIVLTKNIRIARSVHESYFYVSDEFNEDNSYNFAFTTTPVNGSYYLQWSLSPYFEDRYRSCFKYDWVNSRYKEVKEITRHFGERVETKYIHYFRWKPISKAKFDLESDWRLDRPSDGANTWVVRRFTS